MIELTIVGLIVAGAVAFIAYRVVAAIRGGTPSCCSDSDVDPAAPWLSPCDGCAGCGGGKKRKA